MFGWLSGGGDGKKGAGDDTPVDSPTLAALGSTAGSDKVRFLRQFTFYKMSLDSACSLIFLSLVSSTRLFSRGL